MLKSRVRLSNRDDLGGRLGGFLDRYEQYRKMGMSESEAGQKVRVHVMRQGFVFDGTKAYQRIENVLLDAPDLPKMYDCERPSSPVLSTLLTYLHR